MLKNINANKLNSIINKAVNDFINNGIEKRLKKIYCSCHIIRTLSEIGKRTYCYISSKNNYYYRLSIYHLPNHIKAHYHIPHKFH